MLSQYLVRSAVCVLELNVLFVLDAVQVLVQAVQQEGQELLGVVLLVTQKLGRKMAHLSLRTQIHIQVMRFRKKSKRPFIYTATTGTDFKNTRHYGIVSPRPHLLDDICIGFCDLALHAQRISEVQLI